MATVGVGSDAARSKGNVTERLDEVERRLDTLTTARRLEAAAVGRGGLRVHSGGGITLQDGGSLLVDDGGNIRVAGGRIEAVDGDGDDVFVVDTDPASIFLRQQLITDLAVAIFADRVQSADVTATEGTTAITFTDLATVGPTVANVDVSDSGKALVFVSAGMASSFTGRGCRMSFVISGATSEGATLARSVAAIFTSTPFDVGIGRSFAISGLNPGLHTFTAKYRSHSGTEVFFYDRSLVVIGL